MRVVPENRLLIQPTVQRKWILQHRTIEFVLPLSVQQTYWQIWQQYQDTGYPSLHDYLNSDAASALALHECDQIFALMVGADAMRREFAVFWQSLNRPNLVWSIDERSI
ncbi:hypothetical protein [Reinekea sp. G2M2-21]|uniref:hypothetical protein n=1 Tax=Reinekea sp. G2M2-21 TaxID=2788942 RepID=UPI0018AC6C4C|nr:hypothetical protein [Reinekea sp. G2M2-21]